MSRFLWFTVYNYITDYIHVASQNKKINATSACFTSTVSTRLFTTCPTDIMSVFQTVRSDASDGPVWPLRRPGRLLFQPISSDGVRDVRQI